MLLNTIKDNAFRSNEDIDAIIFLEGTDHGLTINSEPMLKYIRQKMENGLENMVLGLELFVKSMPEYIDENGVLIKAKIEDAKKYFKEYRGKEQFEMVHRQYFDIITNLQQYMEEGRLKIVCLQERLSRKYNVTTSEKMLGQKFLKELIEIGNNPEYISPFFSKEWQKEYSTLKSRLELLISKQNIIPTHDAAILQLCEKIRDELIYMEHIMLNTLPLYFLAKLRSKEMADVATEQKKGHLVIFTGSAHRDIVGFLAENGINAQSVDNHIVRSVESKEAIRQHYADKNLNSIEKKYLEQENDKNIDYNSLVSSAERRYSQLNCIDAAAAGKYLADNDLFPANIATDPKVLSHFKKLNLYKPLEPGKPTYSPSMLRRNNNSRNLIRSYEEERQHYAQSVEKALHPNPNQNLCSELMAEADILLDKLDSHSKIAKSTCFPS